MYLQKLLTALLACALASPALARDGGISSLAISRCAGKVGVDTRQSDAAFGLIAIDGIPWVTIERTEQSVGTQPITTTVTGLGALHRRNGTSVPFRFTCVLDAKGQALMFHATHLMRKLGDALPPATFVVGSATYADFCRGELNCGCNCSTLANRQPARSLPNRSCAAVGRYRSPLRCVCQKTGRSSIESLPLALGWCSPTNPCSSLRNRTPYRPPTSVTRSTHARKGGAGQTLSRGVGSMHVNTPSGARPHPFEAQSFSPTTGKQVQDSASPRIRKSFGSRRRPSRA